MRQKAIIITAPSGAGKTTLVKKLLAKRPELAFSVSACTRDKREGEVDGKDYHFLDQRDFKRKIRSGEFIEWEEVYEGMFYGTLNSEIHRIWESGKAVIFDIDVTGAVHLKKELGDKALAIFIAPPSVEILKYRLSGRGTETEESLNKRLSKSIDELEFKNQMDTFVINDDLELAFNELNEKVDEFISA
ncbi:MAG: guanylate kinase [Chitinophagales bacterium]